MFETDRWPLGNVAFTGYRFQKIRSLSGFDSHRHQVPTTASPRTHSFLAKISENELKAELDRVYTGLRRDLGLRRVDLQSLEPEDGAGLVSTPWFDYQISVRIDADDPSLSSFRREILNIQSLEPLRSTALDKIFVDTFDSIEVTSPAPLALTEIIDRLEQVDDGSMTIDFDRNASWCGLKFDGIIGRVVFTTDRIRLETDHREVPSRLVNSFDAIRKRLANIEDVF